MAVCSRVHAVCVVSAGVGVRPIVRQVRYCTSTVFAELRVLVPVREYGTITVVDYECRAYPYVDRGWMWMLNVDDGLLQPLLHHPSSPHNLIVK